jgi:hypothetical protein
MRSRITTLCCIAALLVACNPGENTQESTGAQTIEPEVATEAAATTPAPGETSVVPPQTPRVGPREGESSGGAAIDTSGTTPAFGSDTATAEASTVTPTADQ